MNDKRKLFIVGWLWGVIYSLFLQTRFGWYLDREFTPISVCGGVAGVLIISSTVVGIDKTQFLLGMFAFAGSSTFIRMIYNSMRKQTELEERIR